MARGRNYYVKGASNKQDISPEARELLRNKKDPEDGRWQLGYGIQEPLEMDPTTKGGRHKNCVIVTPATLKFPPVQ